MDAKIWVSVLVWHHEVIIVSLKAISGTQNVLLGNPLGRWIFSVFDSFRLFRAENVFLDFTQACGFEVF